MFMGDQDRINIFQGCSYMAQPFFYSFARKPYIDEQAAFFCFNIVLLPEDPLANTLILMLLTHFQLFHLNLLSPLRKSFWIYPDLSHVSPISVSGGHYFLPSV